MSLRTRLWLVLGTVVVIPLLVLGIVVAVVLPDAVEAQTRRQVATAAAAVSSGIAQECARMGSVAQALGLRLAAGPPLAATRRTVADNDVRYASLLTAAGAPVASAGEEPTGLGSAAGGPPSCAAGRSLPADDGAVFLVERAPITVTGAAGRAAASNAAWALVARDIDAGRLQRITSDVTVDAGTVTLLEGDRPVLATASGALPASLARAVRARLGESAPFVVAESNRVAAVVPARNGVPWTVVVSTEQPGLGLLSTAGIAVLAVLLALVAALLAVVVARSLTRPLADLTDAAERVARGDLDTRIARTRGGGSEVGRLAEAFNRMTTELDRTIGDLQRSRDELRASLARIGETLTITHDLDGLMHVVLETALTAVPSRSAVALVGQTDGRLDLVASHGLTASEQRVAGDALRGGVGVLGGVVAAGTSVRGALGKGRLRPVAGEPERGQVLAVPLRSVRGVTGVIALYDRQDGTAYSARDEESLLTLAGQAGMAVDNVLLHREAQRLSTTDPLTGVWNFRYLSMSLAREIERSTRFARPLAVLMLDLDHFKNINDRYGHQRGDAVLRELSQRVLDEIREVDTFARYGGEEFVVVLPETTLEGAGQLADRICASVRTTPFGAPDEEPITVTVSVGAAAFPEQGTTSALLMRAADEALYVAKHAGRDQWAVAGG